MSRTSSLLRLQLIDLELDEISKRIRVVEDALATDPTIAAAQTELADENRRLDGLRAALADHEFQGSRLDVKIKDLERQLYGGHVQNPKELDGFERELQMVKRQRSELDDKILEQMDQVDAARSRAAAQEKKLQELQDARQAKVTGLKHERDQLLKRMEAQSAERSSIRSNLGPDALRVYDQLRRTKSNRAVSLVKREACAACGVSVPTGHVARIRTGEELVFCSGCGRILSS